MRFINIWWILPFSFRISICFWKHVLQNGKTQYLKRKPSQQACLDMCSLRFVTQLLFTLLYYVFSESLFTQMWKDSRWYAVKLGDGNELHLFDLVALIFSGRPLFLRGGWRICLPALNCHLSSSDDKTQRAKLICFSQTEAGRGVDHVAFRCLWAFLMMKQTQWGNIPLW